jgi:hypothetical protein
VLGIERVCLQKNYWLENADMRKHMLEKIIGVGQESKNTQPRNAELKRNGMKCTNVRFYHVRCLSIRVNVSRDIHAASVVNILANC